MVRRMLALILIVFTATALTTVAQEPHKIVGEWHQQKGNLPPGSLVEFTQDGKLKITTVPENKKAVPLTWNYRIDANTLETTVNYGAKELTERLPFQMLGDEELVIWDPRGRETALKKGRSEPRSEHDWNAADRLGNYKFHIKNATSNPPGIWIIMDTNRERHRINAGDSVVFQNAYKLDNPTFRVYTIRSDGEPGDVVFTNTFVASFNPFWWNRKLKWTGSKLESD